MSRLTVGATVLFLALGALFCPRVSMHSGVDADRVIHEVLRAKESMVYAAGRSYSYTSGGTAREYGVVVKKTPGSKTVWNADGEVFEAGNGPVEWRRYELIRRNFSALVEGEDTVAGRQAWVVRLKPRMRGSAWKQLWVDKQHCAVLASRDWSGRDQVKRWMETEWVSYSTETRSSIAYAAKDSGELPGGTNLERLSGIYVPDGFELMGASGEEQGGGVRLLSFSNGLAALTVEIEDMACGSGSDDQVLVEPCDQGLVGWVERCDRRVVVVGDLPEEEIRKVVNSVR